RGGQRFGRRAARRGPGGWRGALAPSAPTGTDAGPPWAEGRTERAGSRRYAGSGFPSPRGRDRIHQRRRNFAASGPAGGPRGQRAGDPVVGDGISAAMRDLAEFGWVDVPGRRLAETIAAEARRLGVDARILPLSNGWYRVETYGKEGAERAWVAVRAVVRRPGSLRARHRDAVVSGDGRRGRARDG